MLLQFEANLESGHVRRAWVDVDLNAIVLNTRRIIETLSPQTDLLAVVKADAYGRGAVGVSEAALAAGAKWLGVATVAEAMELRDAGIPVPVLVFGAVWDDHDLHQALHHDLTLTLCDLNHARLLEERLHGSDIAVNTHLKIDTGMTRLGVKPDRLRELWDFIKSSKNICVTGIYSHLATAEQRDSELLKSQCRQFAAILDRTKPNELHGSVVHLANTAATLGDAETHYDLARVGIGIYGITPFLEPFNSIELVPAMQVRARVSQVKEVSDGTSISYGGTYTTSKPTRIAVVSIGYADGVPRNLSGKIEVLIRGQRVPQVGAITMDQLMIDVTKLHCVQPDDIATLIGHDGDESVSVVEWAEKLQTIPWKVLCGFKNRLPRVLGRSLAEQEQGIKLGYTRH